MTKTVDTKCSNLNKYLLFIGGIESVVLEMPGSDHVLLGVFRYEGRICCSMERSLKIIKNLKIKYNQGRYLIFNMSLMNGES